jgi:photosystem II stability/assembly factor-like uncharacterized protein
MSFDRVLSQITYSGTNEDMLCYSTGAVETEGWQLIPSGVEEKLYSVHFGSATHGYIGGAFGRCLKSTNGGANWSTLPIPSVNDLMTVWAVTPDDVHIGAWDTILNTQNGGQSWNAVYINTLNFWVTALQFRSLDEGYAFLQASSFINTGDAGNTWSDLTGSGVIDDFMDGYMVDQNNGFAVGGAGLMSYTTDGGQTWPIYDWNNWIDWTPIQIEGVHFTSTTTGFAVADSGVIFRTTNGGVYWSKSYIAGPQDHLMDIFFLNANMGWIVGYNGLILKTKDGGNIWYPEPSMTSSNLNSVYFISEQLGWAVGDNGTILRYEGPAGVSDKEAGIGATNLVIYPNPVQSSSSLTFNLLQEQEAKIDICDITGREIIQVYQGTLGKGKNTIHLDLSGIRDGIYLCRIMAEGSSTCKSFIVSR